MKVFELVPNNGRKSFNGKCKVIIDNDISTLVSYTTNVAEYNHINNKIKILIDEVSTTTMIHINSFLNYYGFDNLSKKDLIKFQ